MIVAWQPGTLKIFSVVPSHVTKQQSLNQKLDNKNRNSYHGHVGGKSMKKKKKDSQS